MTFKAIRISVKHSKMFSLTGKKKSHSENRPGAGHHSAVFSCVRISWALEAERGSLQATSAERLATGRAMSWYIERSAFFNLPDSFSSCPRHGEKEELSISGGLGSRLSPCFVCTGRRSSYLSLLYFCSPSLKRRRQEDQELKVILSYVGGSKPA